MFEHGRLSGFTRNDDSEGRAEHVFIETLTVFYLSALNCVRCEPVSDVDYFQGHIEVALIYR